MREFVTTGRIERGQLKVRNRRSFEAAMKKFRDGDVLITVEKKHATRSVEANRYYFGVCLKLIAEHTGYTVDEVHEWAKAKFIPKHVAICDRNGEIKDDLVIGGSTTRLNKVQFYEYVESIRQFAAEELDVNIPDPNPNWREDMEAA